MRATLTGAAPVRFSKTARSRPFLREATRDAAQVGGPPAVGRRRVADDRLEGPAEGAEAVEADVQADLAHAPVGLPQKEHRALDPPPLEVPVGGLPEGGAEGPYEVRVGA